MANNIQWLNLTNPFKTDTSIIGHVSGRRTDIFEITSSSQSAIILAGAPKIGKSTLVHYLKETALKKWSWRDELADLRQHLHLDNVHFVYVDLKPVEDMVKNITTSDALHDFFVRQCICALLPLSQDKIEPSNEVKDLFRLLRNVQRNDKRCFIMLDAIERLAQPGIALFDLPSRAKTPQERGIALLEQCGAISTLIDLIDEFTHFGVILSIESLPRPRLDDQFAYVSANLARFITMTLQTFTWEDTETLLEQRLENFADTWKDAETFKKLAGENIFSKQEQKWLQEQMGTHPYLLQQFCLHTFHFKRLYAYNYDEWTEIKDNDHRKQLTETFKERLATFFSHLWDRVKEALEGSSQKTRNMYAEFIREINGKSANEVIDSTFWNDLGQELHYILRSEGIVRHDPLEHVHYPGSVLAQYLVQKAKQHSSLFTSQPSSSPTGGGYWLMINREGDNQEPLPLTEIEHSLLKTLLSHPDRCSDTELMMGAWGKIIEKSAFMQRMHQLRKKLKQRLDGMDVIENRYGGIYLLNHPDWFHLA